MKTIMFLDIDGVLNSINWMKVRNDRTKKIDPTNIDNINKFIDYHACDIVLSSSWRIIYDIGEIKNYLKSNGLIGNIIDKTPILYDSEKNRGSEIKLWLTENDYKNDKFVYDKNKLFKNLYKVPYIIIDDDTDMLYEQKDHFLKTETETGFTKKNYYEANVIMYKQYEG